WEERGEACVAEFWGKNRAKELEKFRTDKDCLVLLLGKNGAHGLDLSYVTHIFLTEQIWDRSLETQVIARANRMGAKGAVSVVQLIMKDTMEEQLHDWVDGHADDGAHGVRHQDGREQQAVLHLGEGGAHTTEGGAHPAEGKGLCGRAGGGGRRRRRQGLLPPPSSPAAPRLPHGTKERRRAPPTGRETSSHDHAKMHYLLRNLRAVGARGR
ncbi:unnamed protein product, partial [Discosporangium mesarthrocarpum]